MDAKLSMRIHQEILDALGEMRREYKQPPTQARLIRIILAQAAVKSGKLPKDWIEKNLI